VSPTALICFVAVFATVSAAAFAGRLARALAGGSGSTRRGGDTLPTLAGWGLADRRLGSVMTWFLMGSSIYTVYTFLAVPALVYSVGGGGLFALPYTVIFYPIAFLVLPRLCQVARDNELLTLADVVRARFSSPALATAVAVCGMLATMPYVALQLLGIQALLTVIGVPPGGLVADAALTCVFSVLAVATYRDGLRAPAAISVVKTGLVFGALGVLLVVVTERLGGVHKIFDTAAPILQQRSGLPDGLPVTGSAATAYASLALGSALALLCYPHVLTTAFAARDADVLRRNTIALPAWTLLLGLFALLGVAAAAAGVLVPPGHSELAVPLLVDQVLPDWATGVVLGALGIGALVPAAVMSVSAGTTFTRNVYVEYVHPTATPATQMRVARSMSLLFKFGALAFALGLRPQDSINLQLLGGVWILQTGPSLIAALWTRWFHRRALLAGWAAGMIVGTALVALGGFSSVVTLPWLHDGLAVYAALPALLANVGIAAALTPLFDRAGVARGLDRTVAGTIGLGKAAT
jgi:solute:Na+ symporter, SSS family